MDDLNEKISRLLADPNSMAKIQAAMATLGGSPSEQTSDTVADSPPSPPPVPTAPPPNLSGGSLPDLSMLTRLMPLMSAFGREDDDTRLLQALRPYLHGDRSERLDETMKLLRLTKLLPLLQEQGIFGKAPDKEVTPHG
ncbi:MAG: hypothetical protein IJB26_06020 [Clostridia bacterium]|nr:hypothetical protein [Clostridia bacterium]